MNNKFFKFRWPLTIVAGIFLLILWVSNISGSQITGDSSTNLRIAFNLERNGIISDDYESPYQPTMDREPIPVSVMSMAIGIVDLVAGSADPVMYFTGNRAMYLKYQNLAWLILLSLSTFWAIKVFTSSYFVALLGAVLVNLKLPGIASGPNALGIDSLLTELPAAAVLMLSSTMLALAVHRKKTISFALAGLLFGMLALIKAAFLYIFVGIVLVMSARAIYAWYKSRTWVDMTQVSVLCLVFGIVVLPWMLRNYNTLETFAISDRGGGVLNIRTTLNRMTAEEFRGAIYYWAPSHLQPVMGLGLGFSPSDLERGGRLQRLNRSGTSSFAKDDLEAERAGRPEKAISYYRKARADMAKHRMEFEALGHQNPQKEAASVLQDRSLRSILEHPGNHLAMSVLMMWRGAPVVFPILLIAFIVALTANRQSLAAFMLPAFGMAAFYALLTHFLPRYSVPIAPISVTSIVILGYHAVQSWRNQSSIA